MKGCVKVKTNILISFWSPYHGQTCTTSNLVAIGTYLGIKYNLKSLLMHSQFEKSNLENAFYSSNDDIESMLFDENGIDAIERLARTKQLNSENFTDYTKTILNNRLDLLMGTSKKSEIGYEKMIETISYILSCAKSAYDIVLCDVSAGSTNEVTKRTLEMSDLIIVNLNQNLEILKSFFNKNEWHEGLDNKKYIILLGNYDSNSKYTAKYIKRLFNYEDEIFYINRNIDFLDNHNDHTILRFFFSNIDNNRLDNNFEFMQGISKISARLIEEMKIEEELLKKSLKNSSLFDEIIGVFKK